MSFDLGLVRIKERNSAQIWYKIVHEEVGAMHLLPENTNDTTSDIKMLPDGIQCAKLYVYISSLGRRQKTGKCILVYTMIREGVKVGSRARGYK